MTMDCLRQQATMTPLWVKHWWSLCTLHLTENGVGVGTDLLVEHGNCARKKGTPPGHRSADSIRRACQEVDIMRHLRDSADAIFDLRDEHPNRAAYSAADLRDQGFILASLQRVFGPGWSPSMLRSRPLTLPQFFLKNGQRIKVNDGRRIVAPYDVHLGILRTWAHALDVCIPLDKLGFVSGAGYTSPLYRPGSYAQSQAARRAGAAPTLESNPHSSSVGDLFAMFASRAAAPAPHLRPLPAPPAPPAPPAVPPPLPPRPPVPAPRPLPPIPAAVAGDPPVPPVLRAAPLRALGMWSDDEKVDPFVHPKFVPLAAGDGEEDSQEELSWDEDVLDLPAAPFVGDICAILPDDDGDDLNSDEEVERDEIDDL